LKKLSIPPVLSLAGLIMAAPAVMAQVAQPEQPQQPSLTEPAPVLTQPNEVREGLSLHAALGYEHDSNVFRTPTATSDNAWLAGAGLKFDKNYGLQHVRADLDYTRYEYQHNSDLSYNTFNYSLGWDWSITPRFHGVLTADQRQFRDTETDPTTGQNLVGRRTEEAEVLEGNYDIGARWRAIGGASHTRVKSTTPITWDGAPEVSSWDVGAGYTTPKGTTVTARYISGTGSYHDQNFQSIPSDFDETQGELAVHWPISGKTSFDGRIAHLKREHKDSPQLDFAGPVGNATLNWDVTGKTRILGGYIRELGSAGTVTAGVPAGGQVTGNRWFVSPIWRVTAKTTLNARYDYVRREWGGVAPGNVNFGWHETVETASIGVDWEVVRRVTLSAYYRNERESSNFSSYRDNIYGVLGRFNF
jgi:exopolysaccharide biosynthesis operon protein EpsL